MFWSYTATIEQPKLKFLLETKDKKTQNNQETDGSYLKALKSNHSYDEVAVFSKMCPIYVKAF